MAVVTTFMDEIMLREVVKMKFRYSYRNLGIKR